MPKQNNIDFLLNRPALTGAQVNAVCRHMLKVIPATRNNVSKLYAHVLMYEWQSRTQLDIMNTTAHDFLDALANEMLTPFKAVSTAMEIIQQEEPELKPQ